MPTTDRTQQADQRTPDIPRRRPPKLLDQLHETLRRRHYSPRTEEAYVYWTVQYIRFHGMRHPRELGHVDLMAFLTHLATARNLAASTQNQALNAVVFLYKHVLGVDIVGEHGFERARRPRRLPTVLGRDEVKALLEQMSLPCSLVAELLYGAGLRLSECIGLRIKDLEFERSQIMVRDAKGMQDRMTLLPRLVSFHVILLRAVHRPGEDCRGIMLSSGRRNE